MTEEATPTDKREVSDKRDSVRPAKYSSLAPLERLLRDATVEQARHLAATQNKRKLYVTLTLPPVILNAAVSAIFLVLLSSALEDATWLKLLGALVSVVAGVLIGIETSIRSGEQVAHHQKLAVQFGRIGREVQGLIDNKRRNKVSPTKLEEKLDDLTASYFALLDDALLSAPTPETAESTIERVSEI